MEKELPRFGIFARDYLLVRPGITSLWQSSGRNQIDFESRLRLESWYVWKWSLWLDIAILIRTLWSWWWQGGGVLMA